MNYATPSDADRLAFQHPDLINLLMQLDNAHVGWREIDPTFPALIITCLDRDQDGNALVGGKDKSWHLFRCATDLRSKHYTPQQAARVMDWIKAHCEQPLWETVLVPHGTGPHFHVARRDFSWRKEQGK